MAYSLSPWLKPRFFITGTNRPLAGGLLYTYKAGTTDNATTYSDDGGTPNTNPIVLNSDGECDLYLDDAVSYRFILKNSAGVTQFDKDRVASIGNRQVQSFDNIASLRLTSGTTQANSAQTLGYYSPGDGGANEFYWSSTSTATDNGGTIIKPTSVSGAGRWLAVDSKVVSIRQFGAVGDALTDDSDYIAAAVAYVQSKIVSVSTISENANTVTLLIPSGTYLVTVSESLFNASFTTKNIGLSIQGAGGGQSRILFKPTAGTRRLMSFVDSCLFANINGIGFISDSTSNTCLYAYSTNSVQRVAFKECQWYGVWGKGVHLEGADNNSEHTFTDCGVSGQMQDFLYIPSSNASDQFLNYWFKNFKFWPTATSPATNCMINISLGGSVTLTDCDLSGIKSGTMFKLLGNTHAAGVCRFSCVNTRFELKSDNAKVLDCFWPQGTVTFRDCDLSSQYLVYSESTVAFEITDANTMGVNLLFDRCQLIGSVKFNHGTNDFEVRKKATFSGCQHLQFYDMRDAFIFTNSTNDGGQRAVNLIDCQGKNRRIGTYTQWQTGTTYVAGDLRYNGNNLYKCAVGGVSASAPTTKANSIVDGTVTWDWYATTPRAYLADQLINWDKSVSGETITRRASIKNLRKGLPAAGAFAEVMLPKGALLIGVQLYFEAGSTASTAGCAYSIQDTESTPNVFLTHTAANSSLEAYAEWTGYHVCGNNRSRNIQIVASGATVENTGNCYCILTYLG